MNIFGMDAWHECFMLGEEHNSSEDSLEEGHTLFLVFIVIFSWIEEK